MLPTGHDWPTMKEHTELLVAFGGLPFKNAMVDPGGTGPHVDKVGLATCMEGGMQAISIGPVLSHNEDAFGADWLAPRPNTDVALMLALAHVVITDGKHDKAYLDRCCVGGDELIAYVLGESDGQPKDPAWAAAITGVSANAIVALAREMEGRRTLISITWAMQRADHGEQPFWMAIALAALLGQLGLPGGGIAFGLGTFNDHGAGRLPFRWAAFPQGRNPIDRFIPVARIADMLLNPGATIPYNGMEITFSGDRPGLLGGRQPVPPPSGPAPPGRSVSPAQDGDRPGCVVPADSALCRHRVAGDNDTGAQRLFRQRPWRFCRTHAQGKRALWQGALGPRDLPRPLRTHGLRRRVHRGPRRDGLGAPSL